MHSNLLNEFNRKVTFVDDDDNDDTVSVVPREKPYLAILKQGSYDHDDMFTDDITGISVSYESEFQGLLKSIKPREYHEAMQKVDALEKIIRNKDFNLIIEGVCQGKNQLKNSL